MPVIYLKDAEVDFPIVSFIVRRLIKNQDMSKAILAGISYNTSYEDWYHRKRARDLTPVKWKHKNFPETGGAEKFSIFIKNEVSPIIEKTSRIEAKNRTFICMSFGGIFAHYILFNFGDKFQKYLIVSLSLWYGDRYLIGAE